MNVSQLFPAVNQEKQSSFISEVNNKGKNSKEIVLCTPTIFANRHFALRNTYNFFNDKLPDSLNICSYVMRDSDREYLQKITQIFSENTVFYHIALTDGNLMISGKDSNEISWCYYYNLAKNIMNDAKPLEFNPLNFDVIERWYRKEGMANSIKKEKISEQDYVLEQPKGPEKKE